MAMVRRSEAVMAMVRRLEAMNGHAEEVGAVNDRRAWARQPTKIRRAELPQPHGSMDHCCR